MVTEGKDGGRKDRLGVGDSHFTLLIFNIDKQ